MGRSSLPSLQGRSISAALTDTADTRLGRALATGLQAHPGRSGIHPLPEARDAFAARVLLAGAAQRSLDVQYYIWRGDQTGMMLFEAAWLAAERGVRVRLLLDDINTGGLDEMLAALDAHPNIELRLYNPFTLRKVRVLNFAGRLACEWTTVRSVHDDPAKTLAATPPKALLMLPQVLQAMGEPQRGLDLISPYFVPGEAGTAALAALARRGVKVRILTNSLAASDVAAVHAGYAKRRVDLLQAGVQLFEFKPTGDQEHRAAQNREHKGPGGSSGASLHAKTFAVDRDRIFVGSFNFDPRSALLNTELGFVIASPALAGQLAGFFDTEVPKAAYEVRLAPDGRGLEWIERNGGAEKRHLTEPDTGWLKRTSVGIMSTLPIDWLL